MDERRVEPRWIAFIYCLLFGALTALAPMLWMDCMTRAGYCVIFVDADLERTIFKVADAPNPCFKYGEKLFMGQLIFTPSRNHERLTVDKPHPQDFIPMVRLLCF